LKAEVEVGFKFKITF